MPISTPHILIFLLLLCAKTFGQHSIVPLDKIPKAELELRYENYYEWIFYYFNTGNFDSSMYFINKGIKEFENHPVYYSKMFRYKGLHYDYIDNKDSCYACFNKALVYPTSINDYASQAKIFIDFGVFNTIRNQTDSAIYYYLHAAELIESTDDYLTAGVIQNNIGILKTRQVNYEGALDYYLNAIKAYQKVTDFSLVRPKVKSVYINISNCYRKMGEYQTAHSYLDKAIVYAHEDSDTSSYVGALSQKGLIYHTQGQFENCIDFSLKALKTKESLKESDRFPILYNLIIGYRDLGFYDSAVYYCSIGLNEAEQSKDSRYKQGFLQNLEELYAKKGDYQKSYYYLKLLQEHEDHELSLQKFQTLEDLEKRYQSEKKSAEIERLVHQNEIKKLYLLLSIFIVLFLVGLGYFMIRKRKVSHQLEIAKHREKLSTAILIGQEEERKRLGVELHDSVGATLAHLRMQIECYGADKKDDRLTNLQEKIDEACIELRTISHNLFPQKIEQEGLSTAIQELTDNLNQIQSTEFKAAVYLNEQLLSRVQQSTLYRIVQELSSNIVKHAAASKSSIHLEMKSNELILQVSDNGKGFDQNSNHKGIGIANIRSRIAYLNGQVEILSKSDYGSLFTITLPLAS